MSQIFYMAIYEVVRTDVENLFDVISGRISTSAEYDPNTSVYRIPADDSVSLLRKTPHFGPGFLIRTRP